MSDVYNCLYLQFQRDLTLPLGGGGGWEGCAVTQTAVDISQPSRPAWSIKWGWGYIEKPKIK